MPSVLYLHGFASSPQSQKVQSLRELLAPQDIELNAPDLNVPSFARLDFEAMVVRAVQAAASGPPRAIVGSSLGGMVALEVVRRGIHAPLVLIAPALGIADLWTAKLPPGDPIVVDNYATGKREPIHRAFFEQMARVDADRHPPLVPVTVFMGRNDESVPFDRVAAAWKRWEETGRLAHRSRFVEIGAGDHRLTGSVDEIAAEIRRAVASAILPSLG